MIVNKSIFSAFFIFLCVYAYTLNFEERLRVKEKAKKNISERCQRFICQTGSYPKPTSFCRASPKVHIDVKRANQIPKMVLCLLKIISLLRGSVIIFTLQVNLEVICCVICFT